MKIHSFTIGPLETNAYLVVDEGSRQALLIDPGLESEGIYTIIQKEGLTLSAIVNTHGHFDHVCGNAFFQAKTGAPVLLHREDAPMMAHAAEQALTFGFQVPTPPAPDRLLSEGDEVVMGEHRMRVLHTPGHTPGGICLSAGGLVFVGDTLFAGSIGRTDLPGGSFEVLLASIRNKLLCLPDETAVYPGHGPVTTIGDERAHNPFVTGRGGTPLLFFDT
ncbi:MAG: MBL fold metallo-hydrolase [Candidatus Methylomirabilales bacterium]